MKRLWFVLASATLVLSVQASDTRGALDGHAVDPRQQQPDTIPDNGQPPLPPGAPGPGAPGGPGPGGPGGPPAVIIVGVAPRKTKVSEALVEEVRRYAREGREIPLPPDAGRLAKGRKFLLGDGKVVPKAEDLLKRLRAKGVAGLDDGEEAVLLGFLMDNRYKADPDADLRFCKTRHKAAVAAAEKVKASMKAIAKDGVIGDSLKTMGDDHERDLKEGDDQHDRRLDGKKVKPFLDRVTAELGAVAGQRRALILPDKLETEMETLTKPLTDTNPKYEVDVRKAEGLLNRWHWASKPESKATPSDELGYALMGLARAEATDTFIDVYGMCEWRAARIAGDILDNRRGTLKRQGKNGIEESGPLFPFGLPAVERDFIEKFGMPSQVEQMKELEKNTRDWNMKDATA